MSKYVRVVTEPPTGGSIIDYFMVDDHTDESAIAEMASEVFHNHCDYGYTVLDKDDDDYEDAIAECGS